MRVAIVTESFLPTLNGVTTSVCRVLDYLADHGHEAIIICPAAGAPSSYAGFPVYELPAIAYRQFPVALPHPQVQKMLQDFAPDVLHAASPFLIGAQAIAAANRLGIPSVAIFQTDVAGYARRNRLGATAPLAWRWVRWVHEGADLTLAPSSASIADLTAAGLTRLDRWGRGVDLAMYHPSKRLAPSTLEFRRSIASDDDVVVGYVGRVAPEKQLESLVALRGLPGIRLAIVGDGPSMPLLRKTLKGMPVAFVGALRGEQLATAYASFDVFVTPGTEETFGQTVQEAHASALPVIAPRAGGPIDLVEVGVDGYLYEPDDRPALRRLVERLAANGALRRRMGEAGRRAVLDRSWDAICDELVGHYRVTIEARRGMDATKIGQNFRKVSRSRAI